MAKIELLFRTPEGEECGGDNPGGEGGGGGGSGGGTKKTIRHMSHGCTGVRQRRKKNLQTKGTITIYYSPGMHNENDAIRPVRVVKGMFQCISVWKRKHK